MLHSFCVLVGTHKNSCDFASFEFLVLVIEAPGGTIVMIVERKSCWQSYHHRKHSSARNHVSLFFPSRGVPGTGHAGPCVCPSIHPSVCYAFGFHVFHCKHFIRLTSNLVPLFQALGLPHVIFWSKSARNLLIWLMLSHQAISMGGRGLICPLVWAITVETVNLVYLLSTTELK